MSVPCLWLWCDRERACGKFSVTAACAFGAIPRLRGPRIHSRSNHAASRKLFKVPWCLCSTPRPYASAARAPGRPTARKKPVYRAPLTAILTATALLLVETFRSPPLVSCRTRLLRAWPRSFIRARHWPPPQTLSQIYFSILHHVREISWCYFLCKLRYNLFYFIINPSLIQAWKLFYNYTSVIKCSSFVVSAFDQVAWFL